MAIDNPDCGTLAKKCKAWRKKAMLSAQSRGAAVVLAGITLHLRGKARAGPPFPKSLVLPQS
jgi:hypothetical protein